MSCVIFNTLYNDMIPNLNFYCSYSNRKVLVTLYRAIPARGAPWGFTFFSYHKEVS